MAQSFFGTQVGIIIMSPFCGFMADTLGYEAAFYVIGALSLLWYALWLYFVFETPHDHPRIDPAEREALEDELSECGLTEQKPPFPLRQGRKGG